MFTYTRRLKLLTNSSYIAQNYKGGTYFSFLLAFEFRDLFRELLSFQERKLGPLTTLIIMGQCCVLWTATMLFRSYLVEDLYTHPRQFSQMDTPAAYCPVKNYHPKKISPKQTHWKFVTHQIFPDIFLVKKLVQWLFPCTVCGHFDPWSAQSLVSSVLGHFSPETKLYIQFSPWSIQSLVSLVLSQLGPWSLQS